MFSALIIDADQDASKDIEGALASYGFEFTATQDAPEAMSLAKSATPDIIFLRVELPNVSGFSVCNKLRRNDETKYIPLVMYASGVSDDVFNQHRNLKTHADEYLKLPFAGASLVEAVKGLIELGESSAPEAVEAEGSLDVDIDDVEDVDAAGGGEVLEMKEFDQDFAEIDEGAGEGAEDLGAETEAAFDALVDDPEPAPEPEPEPEPVVEAVPEPIPEPIDEPGAPEPEPEPSASGSGTEFKAQREAIQLKSQLNAKNREILGLKDELESYERSVLDAKHKNRELLAQIGDLEEKLIAAEEQVITAKEQSEASVRDKNTILKREEGLKTRFEHAQKKIKDLETELEAAAAREQQALATGEETQAKFEVLQTELSTVIAEGEKSAAELESARAAIDSAEGELSTARTRAGELSETITKLEGELSDAHAATEAAKQAAAEELEQKLAEAQAAAESAKSEALSAQAQEHAAELEFNETQQRNTIEKVKAEAAETEAAARAEVEKLRAQIMEAEEAAQADKSAAAQREAELQEELGRLGTDLERTRKLLDTTEGELGTARAQVAARQDAERRAQQALAVAFKVLDGQSTS